MGKSDRTCLFVALSIMLLDGEPGLARLFMGWFLLVCVGIDVLIDLLEIWSYPPGQRWRGVREVMGEG